MHHVTQHLSANSFGLEAGAVQAKGNAEINAGWLQPPSDQVESTVRSAKHPFPGEGVPARLTLHLPILAQPTGLETQSQVRTTSLRALFCLPRTCSGC